MSDRPEAFFPLFAPLTTLPGIGPKLAEAFAAQGVEVPMDLLLRLPTGGHDRRLQASILGCPPGRVVTVEVTIGAHHRPSKPGRPYRIDVSDQKASFALVFFHARAAYLENLLPSGQRRIVSGKLEFFDGVAQMAHPDHVLAVSEASQLAPFEPVYPLGAGLTARIMSTAIGGALERLPAQVEEWQDPALLAREAWPDWKAALLSVHRPANADALLASDPARQRLAYDEVLAHQVLLALLRAQRMDENGVSVSGTGGLTSAALAQLPYRPTGAQTRALEEIRADMAAPQRMYRLLQGDVGAGKTLVAFLAMLICVEAGGQAALMVPTEILAQQHAKTLRELAGALPLRIEVLTGSDGVAAREDKLAALRDGSISIAVGTHALFQDAVRFAALRLAVIDEQHRFGVKERLRLVEKGTADILLMTATPIPRSLALTAFGDMDLSVLDEKPPGRKPVQTSLVSDARLDEVVTRLRAAIARGQQAFWVCPLVRESETMDLVSAEDRADQLRELLGAEAVALVHGQMPGETKEREMDAFVRAERSVLVATTAIEVGVDVPNASIMIIERAESFGLAQLHQLRGRVGRGAAAATCVLLYRDGLSETAARRLRLLRETEDGFRIAEEDLAMRGAGDILGTAQSGLPKFRVADPETQPGLIAMARRDAQALLVRDPDLTSQRGRAVRILLELMNQRAAQKYFSTG